MISSSWEVLVVAMLAGVICWLNYARFRDVLYPAFLQGMLWTTILFLYWLLEDSFVPVSFGTLSLVLLGVFLFSTGSYLATFRYQPVRRIHLPIDAGSGKWVLTALLIASTVGLPFYLSVAFSLGLAGPSDDFFFNLRYGTTEDIYSYGFAAYFGTLALSTFFLFMTYGRNTKFWLVYIAASVSFVYAMFSSGRTSLFLWVIAALGILAIQRRIRPSRLGMFFLIFATGSFVAVALGTGKGVVTTDSFAENIQNIYGNFLEYLLSPLPALDVFLSQHSEPGYGENVFRFFVALFEKLGAPVRAVPLVQEYSFVPMPTNVYTYFQPYYADFKWFGVVFFPFIIGYIHGHIYLGADKGNPDFIFLYGVSCYPLFMQFFQDQYFNLLSTWLQILLVLLVFASLRRANRRLEVNAGRDAVGTLVAAAWKVRSGDGRQ